jgi:protein subunit release factor A
LIDPADVKVEHWPPRQKGGQHVGVSPAGVKVTHLPTGIEAFVDIGRSQFINREIAMDMVLAALTHPRFR